MVSHVTLRIYHLKYEIGVHEVKQEHSIVIGNPSNENNIC
jgi:hypothetical protein